MALSRRTGARFQASIWPGFVDAMTGLLLVLMFVLTIFMVVQFVLRETIKGQGSQMQQMSQELADKDIELSSLAAQIAELGTALGFEQQTNDQLLAEVATLTSDLQSAQNQSAEQAALIGRLSAQVQDQTGRLADFETQVASLLAQRRGNEVQIAGLEDQATTLTQELTAARDEIDAQSEAARLAAVQRELLEAQLAEVRAKAADLDTNLSDTLALLAASRDQAAVLAENKAALEAQADDLQSRLTEAEIEAAAAAILRGTVADLQQSLSDEEAAKLAQMAAAEQLRRDLETAQGDLDALTLALADEKKRAEDTLTLLAAANAAQTDLDAQLATTILALQAAEAAKSLTDEQLATARGEGAATAEQLTEALARLTAREAELTQIQAGLADAQATLGERNAERDQLAADLAAAQTNVAALTQTIAGLRDLLAQAQGTVGDRDTELAQARADLVAAEAQMQIQQAELDALRAQLDDAAAARTAAANTTSDLRTQLAAALAAKALAEDDAVAQLTEAEQQAVLLAEAKDRLSQEQEISTEAQRQVELLRQQIKGLQSEIATLGSLLDASEDRAAASNVELQNLGSRLNSALAEATLQARRVEVLETAEKERLEAEAKRLAEEAQTLERYKSEFLGQVRELLEGRDGVRLVGDRFVFSSEVLFPPGGADLSPAGENEITKIASLLREIAADIPDGIDWVIQVDGHTDNVPIRRSTTFSNNWELSQARALSVVLYMVNFLGLPPERMSANGFGQYQPLNPADTAEARAQNRRIELKFTEK